MILLIFTASLEVDLKPNHGARARARASFHVSTVN